MVKVTFQNPIHRPLFLQRLQCSALFMGAGIVLYHLEGRMAQEVHQVQGVATIVQEAISEGMAENMATGLVLCYPGLRH